MTKLLTAILAVVAVTALVVVSMAGFLVGGVAGVGGQNQTITISVPGGGSVGDPIYLASTVPTAPEASIAPMGGTIYNRIIEFSEGITVDGTTRIDGVGAATFSSTTLATTTITALEVSGASTFASDLTVSGTFSPTTYAPSGTSTLATTTISWLEVTSNAHLRDVLIVDGITTLTGAATLSSTLEVTATSTLATSTVTWLEVASNAHLRDLLLVDGTATVTGAATLSSTLGVTATSTLATSTITWLEVSSEAHLRDVLTVDGVSTLTGAATLSSTLEVTATSTLATTTITDLQVSGETTLTGNVIASNGLTASDGLISSATSTLATTSIAWLEVDANAHLRDILTVDATTTLSGSLIGAKADVSRLVQGGTVEAIDGDVSSTLTTAQVCENSILTQTASTTGETGLFALTVTLPTATDLNADCLLTNGDMITLLFRNTTSTYGASTTIITGSGIELLEYVGGAVVVEPLNSARLILTRVTSGVSVAEVISYRDAD